ncbi:hypothetical protein [Blastococcus saxobsidens]|uniref:hypothetical protein n=1 Tax=Blastococcus saxobsidens TaxID=138336 RepID=UPI000CEC8EC1|nr:hypothetical protein [Blastococcus saxobsidens]
MSEHVDVAVKGLDWAKARDCREDMARHLDDSSQVRSYTDQGALPEPEAGPGRTLHDVSAAGVNFADTHHAPS